jgi:hypothetical protein
MGQKYSGLNEKLQEFVKQQKIFFVATAAPHGRVNLSPKGMDSFRIISANKIIWLNLTGSGNETAAHLLESNRITVMFCAVEGTPMILRLYGQATVFHPRDDEWNTLAGMFPPIAGARQYIAMDIDLVQTSCGMGVPCFDYAGDRQLLTDWAEKKGDAGLQQYWSDKNQVSLDGRPTGIFEP